jgi:hypothetical protein
MGLVPAPLHESGQGEKSRSVLPPSPEGGSSESSRGRKLLSDAHASISVPSTLKCSVAGQPFGASLTERLLKERLSNLSLPARSTQTTIRTEH